MDSEAFFDLLMEEVSDCLDEGPKHAVLMVYDDESGQVKTYAINADYSTVRMLVGSVAMLVNDDNEERVIN